MNTRRDSFATVLALFCLVTGAAAMARTTPDFSGNRNFLRKSPSFLKEKLPGSFVLNTNDGTDWSTFDYLKDSYTIAAPRDLVWDTYMADFARLWSGKLINFTMAQLPTQARPVTDPRQITAIVPGLMVFLDAKVAPLPIPKGQAPGFMIAMEVLQVNLDKHFLEFGYLEGTPSRGRQLLTFHEAVDEEGNPKTLIVHEALFKGNSLAIHAAYPAIHRQLLGEFHRTLKRVAETRFQED